MVADTRKIGLIISLAGFAISVNTLPALVTYFSTRFAVPIASFGLVFLLQYASYTCSSLIVGRLHSVRQLPLHHVFIGALMISSISLFWIGSITTFAVLIGIMVIIGGAGGLIESIGTSLITTSNGSNRMLYTSQFFYSVGAFLSPMTVGFLLYIGIPVPMIGNLIGIFSLGIGLVVAWCVYSPRTHTRLQGNTASPPKMHSSTQRKAVFPFFFFTMVVYVMLESSIGNWFAVYAHNGLQMSPSQSSFSLSLFWVGLGVSRLLYMFIIIANHRRTLAIYIGIMMCAMGIFIFLPIGSPIICVYIAIFLLGLGCGPIWPLLIEYCSKTCIDTHLLIYLVGAGSIGALLGPVLTSSLFSLVGISNMMVILVAYMMMIAVSATTTIIQTKTLITHNHKIGA